jgi:hypothetical protein
LAESPLCAHRISFTLSVALSKPQPARPTMTDPGKGRDRSADMYSL